MRYRHSILGGTFDKLHAGHKQLIKEASKNSEKITIGITSDEMASGKSNIEDYKSRKNELEKYLQESGISEKTITYQLTDIYGPALTEENIDAIFATEDTEENAKKVKKERRKKGLSDIDTVIVDQLLADDGREISSSRIRFGEIDRNGHSYLNLLKTNDGYKLPENMRDKLKTPFGEIMGENDFSNLISEPFLITVGDVATAKLIKKGKTPNLSVFDLRTNRNTIKDKEILNNLPTEFEEIDNLPATINAKAIDKLNQLIKKGLSEKPVALRVSGEEDLLTIPCVLLAPLDASLIYGLTEVGGIKIHVTEEKKEELVEILKKLQPA